jgi:hypothetical protein
MSEYMSMKHLIETLSAASGKPQFVEPLHDPLQLCGRFFDRDGKYNCEETSLNDGDSLMDDAIHGVSKEAKGIPGSFGQCKIA